MKKITPPRGKKLYEFPALTVSELAIEQGIAASGSVGVTAENFDLTIIEEDYW